MTTSRGNFRKASIWRRILGSALSAAVGWTTLMIFFFSWNHSHREQGADSVQFYLFLGGIAGCFIFLTWIIVLVPLYLLIPLDSFLWKWPVCSICGVLSGGVIMSVYGRITVSLANQMDPLVILAAMVGGMTCLFGSLTRNHFQLTRP